MSGFGWAFALLTLLTYPYVYLPVAARLRQLPPAVEESARLLGRRPAAAFATVVLPQARAAIVAGALLVFLYVIADFGAVQLLRYDTLTRAIYANYLLDPEVAVALSLALGVLAIVVVVAQRRVAGGTRQDARREGRSLTVALGRWRVAALAFVGGLLGLALAAPVAVLVYWTVRGVEAGAPAANSLVADPGRLVEPAINTSVASVAAALVAVAVVLPVAFLTARHRSRVGGGAAALVIGGFALPGLVIALALAFWTLRSPGLIGALYQTLPLLVGAYALHFGALALGPAQVAASGVPRRLDDAARTLGRGRLARLATIDLPLMAPGLAAGGGAGAAVGHEGAADHPAAGPGRLPDPGHAHLELHGGRLLGRRQHRGPRPAGGVRRPHLAARGAPRPGAVVRRLATLRWAMALVAVVAFAAAAAGIGSRASYGAQTTADEPHYLLTALSLAQDGDLDVRDEFAGQSYRPFHEIALAPQARPLADGRLIEPHDPCSRRSSRPRRRSAAGSSPS